MLFGERLQQTRKEHHSTQQDVAAALNVSRQTISSWETGKSYPDIDSLIRLSDFYDMSLDTMLKEDEGMKNYLKKQEVMAEIKPTRKLTVVIDILFLVIIIFTPSVHIMKALVLLMGLLNMAVIVHISNLAKSADETDSWVRWLKVRWWWFGVAVISSFISGFSIYQQSFTNLSQNLLILTFALWFVLVAEEIRHHFTK
ncbi:helix-turn-helix domain-containing protein [Lactobacillus sp. LC28-10]|uniref:Helix-turn-helix domain-containing protein n=1 Tax=Secundilactobacillus angelensis TaxID=2722706 RepID=A0ABX1KVZ1_9LACO|nr:helix-turn-helix domain-containing protein [Secundilactobacillus angelensis]MCH5461923.1 helix-turn-helix domain-containing protein [Secundilactobacillus angelensis]NLR17410.1 helix-turn-helix domain-containing protein [Secundilactobacillus angelensis]